MDGIFWLMVKVRRRKITKRAKTASINSGEVSKWWVVYQVFYINISLFNFYNKFKK